MICLICGMSCLSTVRIRTQKHLVFFFWVKKCISILDVKQFYPDQPIKYLSFFSSFGVSFLRFDPEILIETLTYIKVKLIKKNMTPKINYSFQPPLYIGIDKSNNIDIDINIELKRRKIIKH